MSVSREQAHQIASEHLLHEDIKGESLAGETTAQKNPRIREVLAANELRVSAPRVYGLRIVLEDCWIAYVDQPFTALRSSHVVLVTRASGEVVYSGPANDEG